MSRFCHRIHLIEPSVVCQGMHVDNIALTYELNDINLNYKTIREDNELIGTEYSIKNNGGADVGRREVTTNLLGNWDSYGVDGIFMHTYLYEWVESSINSIRSLRRNLAVQNENKIEFTVPTLYCKGAAATGEWGSVGFNLFEMTVRTKVKRIKFHKGTPVETVYVPIRNGATEVITGAATFATRNDEYASVSATEARLRYIGFHDDVGKNIDWSKYYKTTEVISTANPQYANKNISFNTETLTPQEIEDGYEFQYNIECTAATTNSLLVSLDKKNERFWVMGSGISLGSTKGQILDRTSPVYIKPNDVRIDANINVTDMSETADGGPLTMKGVKYNCYDLLRKALLTVDTHLLDPNQKSLDPNNSNNLPSLVDDFPIIIDPIWVNRLKTCKMQETVFEGKNLWEVFLQIGYYLHAIPYLQFATDGTDRFMLTFRQLGDTKVKEDTSTKLTVFNSLPIHEYFAHYDSSVTNLFSPQNLCEEFIAPHTSDATSLVSNDTAELQTTYPITEIVKFDVIWNGQTENALSYIFEKSIYDLLTTEDPFKVYPSKGSALYYNLGDNKIQGLNYVPPTVNNNGLMAFKRIMQLLWQGKASIPDDIKFNDVRFHIVYRTQDSARINQVRPDLERFIKNSAYEKYPHAEQYFGQQDKIIDSERFSANLWGRLVRVGNHIYQRQEYAGSFQTMKEAGDLVRIGNENYYVTEVENEFYPDAIFQKVTYSKNFNQISMVCSIPSEPRFYEVSERSKVRREVRIMEFFKLSTERNAVASMPRFLNNTTWKDFIKKLIFNREKVTLPNFAWTRFMADPSRYHTGSSGQIVESSILFPSSEIDRSDPNNIRPKTASDHSDCIVPVLHFPLHDGIVFEWDMVDNFKAADFIDPNQSGGSSDKAYLAQQAYRYCDIMGRADLFKFKLFNKLDWTPAEMRMLPKPIIEPSSAIVGCDNANSNHAIALDKDGREEISFNYQINLLHGDNSEYDFITFPNLFGSKDSPLKMLLSKEVQSLFDEDIVLKGDVIIADDVEYELADDERNAIRIDITAPNGVDLSQVKSIVMYQQDEIGGRYAYIAYNVEHLPDAEKLKPWYIYPVFNE